MCPRKIFLGTPRTQHLFLWFWWTPIGTILQICSNTKVFQFDCETRPLVSSLFLRPETSGERNLYIFTNMPASDTCDNSCLLGRYIVRNRILILSKRQIQNDFYCGYGCYEEDKLSQNSCCKLNKWIHTVSDLIGKHSANNLINALCLPKCLHIMWVFCQTKLAQS